MCNVVKASNRRWWWLFGEQAIAFVILLALVVAITWPWTTRIGNAFIAHWDPPLHAWKVWNMADAILHGHLLPVGNSLNAFYPNSGSLYYESLYWPQGVVAAPILLLTNNPVLAFHISYLFFWILSGLCFGAMLREIGCSKAASYFGAAAFTILPFRTGYIAEFNMQMCFGPPLFLLFLAKWCRTRRAVYACAAAAALCFQAASEMYTAVFFGLCLPFVLEAVFVGRTRDILQDRRTWIAAVLSGVIAAVFAIVFFLPYLGQLGRSVSRPLSEVAAHSAEPLCYLASSRHMAHRLLPSPMTEQEEVCLYPTVAILILAFGLFFYRLEKRLAKTGTTWHAHFDAETAMRVLRAVLLLFFLLDAAISVACKTRPSSLHEWLPIPMVILSLAIPFVTDYRSDGDRLFDGLCGAAFFAFFMSLGPVLSYDGATWQVDNHLFLFVHGILPFMQGFRVASRFGMIVILCLATAAALSISRLSKAIRSRCHSKCFLCLVWGIIFSLMFYESCPRRIVLRRAKPHDTPVLKRLDARSEPYCLLLFPAWDRYYDSDAMFRIGGVKRLLAASWGGAKPPFSKMLETNFNKLAVHPDRFQYGVWSIWPECLVLFDRLHMKAYFSEPFQETQKKEYERLLNSIADPVDADSRFVLYRIHPRSPAKVAKKFVRHDFVTRFPRCTFTITPYENDSPVTLKVKHNGKAVFVTEVPAEGGTFSVDIPDGAFDTVEPDMFYFRGDKPFSLDDFRLSPLEKTIEDVSNTGGNL